CIVLILGLTGLKKKTRGTLSFQTALSTKTKKFAERKLTLWEYVFGPKRSSKGSKNHVCQLAERQEQTRCEEDLRCQATPGDVLVYTDSAKSSKDSRRLVEPQPKPPSYKLPRAVLLSRAMVEGFAEKGDCETCESKMVTPTASRKLYEEMRPASNTKGIAEYRENLIRPSVDVKPYEKSTSRRVSIPINAHVATAKILRQAMSREEPRIHSRIEQLKILVNEKITKSQRATRREYNRSGM
ncbi:uncharacterized protein, partial [Temnothorax nylanderi]|uniref:uncharacterized protein n=1 Tax=Temnothorax nylanderi TaxID=102681 RepID=UPI003A8B85AC